MCWSPGLIQDLHLPRGVAAVPGSLGQPESRLWARRAHGPVSHVLGTGTARITSTQREGKYRLFSPPPWENKGLVHQCLGERALGWRVQALARRRGDRTQPRPDPGPSEADPPAAATAQALATEGLGALGGNSWAEGLQTPHSEGPPRDDVLGPAPRPRLSPLLVGQALGAEACSPESGLHDGRPAPRTVPGAGLPSAARPSESQGHFWAHVGGPAEAQEDKGQAGGGTILSCPVSLQLESLGDSAAPAPWGCSCVGTSFLVPQTHAWGLPRPWTSQLKGEGKRQSHR